MTEWISVEDRKPEFALGKVLVFCPPCAHSYDGIFTAWWEKGAFQDCPPNCGCTGFGAVSHWRPLPEEPDTGPINPLLLTTPMPEAVRRVFGKDVNDKFKPGNLGDVMILDENGKQKWVKQE